MSVTYRLGAIGFAHMHVNSLLDRFAELPNVEWVACADTVPAVLCVLGAKDDDIESLLCQHLAIVVVDLWDADHFLGAL